MDEPIFGIARTQKAYERPLYHILMGTNTTEMAKLLDHYLMKRSSMYEVKPIDLPWYEVFQNIASDGHPNAIAEGVEAYFTMLTKPNDGFPSAVVLYQSDSLPLWVQPQFA